MMCIGTILKAVLNIYNLDDCSLTSSHPTRITVDKSDDV